MLIIGERINTSRKQIAQAVMDENGLFIRDEAKNQTIAGADYIDVNAGTFMDEEAERLKWIIKEVQEATKLPLCIDSPDPKVIEFVLPLVIKTPMLNSVTLEPSRLDSILPLAVEHKTS